MDIREHVISAFRKRHGTDPDFIARAPGRVNLLGEHVDYNDGFVLPVAIDRATWLAFRLSPSSQTSILALDLGEESCFDAKSVNTHLASSWARYPAGMLWSLSTAGLETPPMDAVFASDVPRGAGLSSSASVEMAFGAAWEKLGGWSIPPMELARLGQQAENDYVGVNCGIMDQFASACGEKDRLLHLDCRSLEWQTLRLPGEVSIVVANTAVERSLSGSAYNDRRAACEEAVRTLAEFLPGIQALRDVSVPEFNLYADKLSRAVEKRARHVVEEIERTRRAVPILKAGRVTEFGELMDACHASLRDLFEVSCPELDLMVEIGRSLPGCYGARLTGAGFGGCTVNLVQQEMAEDFSRQLSTGYQRATGLHPEVYICHAADGAGVI
jgi:galactokinase